jgi:molecular chaperone GrpE
MKRKDEANSNGKPADPPAEPTPEAGGEKPAESLVDIGPEVEAPGEKAPTPEQLELSRLNDRFLRLQADFDNYRKRTNREREESQKRAAEAVLADLIPILDNLEFGLQQALSKPGGESFVEGLRLIQTQLFETVRKHGLEAMDSLGKDFDPRVHEAMAYAPSNEAAEGLVVAQTRRGYRLGDRLLRAAMVVVSSGPAKGADGQCGEG